MTHSHKKENSRRKMQMARGLLEYKPSVNGQKSCRMGTRQVRRSLWRAMNKGA